MRDAPRYDGAPRTYVDDDSEEPATSQHSFSLLPVRSSAVRVGWVDAAGAHSHVVDRHGIVGSAPGSGLLVCEATVSRVHAELETKADGLWVRDLGSTNGTFVDGLRVISAHVPNGSTLRLGAAELSVVYDSEREDHLVLWPGQSFYGLVGASVQMRELFARLARVAANTASVLINGETGTGKELVARAIHDASPRADGPFVVVDCAALTESLLEAELFGHARGAFTGAVGARAGAIEAAHGGTVFLDEIGELPVSMQPRLLRALESKTVRRIGETSHRPVDVRFISATHRDLLGMVGAGGFREDLYFRLSVLPLNVPALRDRREDIALLAEHFLRAGGETGALEPGLVEELRERPWRGNVRELRNFIERARALGMTEALALSAPESRRGSQPSFSATDETPPPSSTRMLVAPPRAEDPMLSALETPMFDDPYKKFRECWVDIGEREYLRRLLVRYGRDVAEAAKKAELNRTYIYRLIRKHDL